MGSSCRLGTGVIMVSPDKVCTAYNPFNHGCLPIPITSDASIANQAVGGIFRAQLLKRHVGPPGCAALPLQVWTSRFWSWLAKWSRWKSELIPWAALTIWWLMVIDGGRWWLMVANGGQLTQIEVNRRSKLLRTGSSGWLSGRRETIDPRQSSRCIQAAIAPWTMIN